MLQKISEEACRFIYKNYYLDEISMDKDTVMYCLGDRLIFGIHNSGSCFDFLIIFNKEEQTELEARRNEFPTEILSAYDPKCHGDTGQSVRISVADMETWEAVKKLMLIKMKPNRKPFPQEGVKKSVNGGRCDMCVHYVHHTCDNDHFKKYVKERLDDRWGDDCEHDRPCPGQQKDCGGLIPIGLPFGMNTAADTITYAILPFVKGLM